MGIPQRHQYHFRIGLVLLASAGFLLVSIYLRSFTEHNIFPILFPAVVLSSWLGGKLGGLISTGSLALGTAYFHLPPEGFAVGDPDDAIRLGTFTVCGAFVAWLSGSLRQNQRLMVATLNGIGDGVIATDRRGRIQLLNPMAQALTGWPALEAKGRLLGEVFRSVSDAGKEVPLPLPRALQGVVELPDGTNLIARSGTQIPIDDSLAPVQMDSRNLGSILVFRDATRRKQNEAALLEAERQRLQAQRMEAVGRLAGGVAHDFNNLLTVINGYADVLSKEIDAKHSARMAAEAIRKAGERAAGLTRQLLVFSRGRPAQMEVADLNQVVANFETMLRRLIGEDIDLTTKLSHEPLRTRVDIGQIEQVIMNLAVNARDAMPHGGRLAIETGMKALHESGADPIAGEPETAYAELSVTDTGTGMDQKTLAHLFEPFFTTKDMNRGTGLGLSVSFGIVKSHQGHFRVKSEPGRGSVFSVYLPLAETGAALSAAAAAEAAHASGVRTSATILLVEDNVDVRRLMRDILIGLGCAVLEASQGEEAVSIAENHPERIDLMVTDIVMPGLSGLDLAKRLASVRPGMSVLYVSGYSGQEVASRAQWDQQIAYIQKPFRPSELAHKVTEMLGRGKQRPTGAAGEAG